MLKKIFVTFSVFILTVFTLLGNPCDNLDDLSNYKKFKIGWYPQYPYIYSENEFGYTSLTGWDVELTRAIATKADIEIELVKLPRDEQLKQLKNGKIDIMLSSLKTPDREKDFWFSSAIRAENDLIFTNKDIKYELDFNDISTFLASIKLNKLKLGVTSGTIYTNYELNDFIYNPENADNIITAFSDVLSFKNLKNNNAAAILADSTVGASIEYQKGWYDQFDSHILPGLKKKDVYYMFSKKNVTKKDVAAFNKSLLNLKRDGQFYRIVETYLLPLLLKMTVDTNWYFLIILAGTVAYCICGLKGVFDEKLNFGFSIIFISIYSLGGGALRDILTGRFPVFFINEPFYIYTVLFIICFVFLFSKLYHYIKTKAPKQVSARMKTLKEKAKKIFNRYLFIIIDGIGISAFIVFGVLAALEIKASPILLWGPILSMITTCGGGLLCSLFQTKQVNIARIRGPEIAVLWGFFLSLTIKLTSEGRISRHYIVPTIIITVTGSFLTYLLIFYIQQRRKHKRLTK